MIWIGLISLIFLLLAIDLTVLHKKGALVSNRRAAVETFFWISVASLFSLVVYWLYREDLVANPEGLSPSGALVTYITGYLIELSLSVDNLFVIAMIFASFKIPLHYQHRVLFWGILGAIVFRGLMIGLGIILIQQISWMTYVFGGFLLFTAIRMLVKEEKTEEGQAPFSKRIRRLFRISPHLEGEKFWFRRQGIRMFTPLFAALVMIELTDLLFALDSIPAILAVTTDPFLVFSSNMFAILGLRAMYFFLANMLKQFHYLKYSVFAILVFVSIKLLLLEFVHFPEWFSLSFIGVSLLTGILVSLYRMKAAPPVHDEPSPTQ